MPRAIVLNPADNVATLLGTGNAGEACVLEGERAGTLVLLQDVPFGHKICIADTAAGATIVKYGQVIGRASRAVRAGEHMHVHNIESARARGDLHKG
ncbi:MULTISPECIES: UxaA family hydrolase [Cupriavidus]|uniref:D-galactarate dehydratase n=1 Tax=Cupriavidus oxalaticus TaxID=96344 RepID=A0A4P7L4D2_9BURK|nr:MULTISPECIES: UxaA family hydrolase [Cupriavidus]MBF6990087.1 UxaA family hydrolase [Cupriavidus sp. IK-TO18]QBY50368.1 D-galactarate dehydratase [Cupriavidus oxalaticus]TDF64020.1 D-galactarate dehydratase [Cupriavidus sp. L7L]